MYIKARVFVLRIRVSCAFCTCGELQLRMERKSTYFEAHEYILNAFQRYNMRFFSLANQIVLLKRSDA